MLVGDPGGHLTLQRRVIPPARQGVGIVPLAIGHVSFIVTRRAMHNEAKRSGG